MSRTRTKSVIAFNVGAYLIITFVTIFCLLPFILIISGSFTDNKSITLDGYHLIPKVFSLKAYQMIFAFPETIVRAYTVTTLNTLLGTATGLLLIAMDGYVLSRKEFRYRNKISFFIYFTTIFGGGLVPWYIMIAKVLSLRDSYIALWFPQLMSPFLIILMRTFISSSIPDEIFESAKIDGAGHFKCFTSIAMPIIKPGLATVGLFLALGYWNDWYMSSLFITTPEKQELQFYLYNILNTYETINRMLSGKGVTISTNMPTESVKLAMAVIATGPVLLFYPFVQKYFVAGITVGAVKG